MDGLYPNLRLCQKPSTGVSISACMPTHLKNLVEIDTVMQYFQTDILYIFSFNNNFAFHVTSSEQIISCSSKRKLGFEYLNSICHFVSESYISVRLDVLVEIVIGIPT